MNLERNITVAYPMWGFNESFVSRKAYESDFVGFLTDYVSVLKLPYEYIQEGCDFNPDPDYLLVNIDSFGLRLFLLREQGKIDTPFLIHFHVIYSQDINISYLLPLLREDDIVIVGSEYSRRCLLRISESLEVPVIPLSLDIDEINSIAGGESNSRSGGREIAYLGQLIKLKGISELIECMPEIMANVNEEVTLNVIGPLSGGDIFGEKSEYVMILQKRAEELGISRNINWTGVLMGEEKYRTLARSDIFVNPSTFKIETFGVVNTEALACGLPVVCTQWSAFNEIIQDGMNGFLVDVNDAGEGSYQLDRHQLVARITQLLNDKTLLDKMKNEARKSSYRYHYKNILPRLTGLLKKKQKGITGQWEKVKAKTFLDFHHMFQPRWLKTIRAGSTTFKTYQELASPNGKMIKLDRNIRLEIFKYLSGR